MLHETKAQVKLRLGALLDAWSSADIVGLAGSLAEDVVFASPYTEPVDAAGLTCGKLNVLQRLCLERGRFDKVEIVDVLMGDASIVVFLRAGETELSCLIEIDDQARFRRLIATLSEMTKV
jgi:ketosteroid isomerase-like protein